MTQPVPTYPSELDSLLARLVDMQEDVVAGADAVPVSFYAQEQPVYWTNSITGFTVERVTENIDIITYRITMRLVLALVTEGFSTEAEQKMQLWLPYILSYFATRRQLKRTSADSAVPFLDPRGAVISGGAVRGDIQNSGIGQLMFGIDFSIEVPMYQQTEQVIF
jgi:hypothetical protein